MKSPTSGTLTLLFSVAAFGPASAALISVNFREANGNANQTILPATAAGGGAGVSALNWNNVSGAPGGPVSGLVDEAGSATTAAVAWSSGGMWGDGTANTDATAGNGNAQLLRGYLDDNQGSPTLPINISLTGIPFAEYDLVVYFSTDTTGGSYGTITATAANGIQTGATTGTKDTWGPSGTPASPGNPTINDTNSLRISGLQGNLAILAPVRSGAVRHSISGLQLIAVPEPGSFTLCGLASLAWLGFRRRSR